jgi:preprotein translocase subunit YajC
MARLAVIIFIATIPAMVVLRMRKERKYQRYMREEMDFVRKGEKGYCRGCGQLNV